MRYTGNDTPRQCPAEFFCAENNLVMKKEELKNGSKCSDSDFAGGKK